MCRVVCGHSTRGLNGRFFCPPDPSAPSPRSRVPAAVCCSQPGILPPQEGPVPNRDLMVIGASAGGIEALQQICAGLPPDFNAAVPVVLHTSNHSG